MIFTLTDRMYNVLDAYETDDYLIGQYTGSILETLEINVLSTSAAIEHWIRGNYVLCSDIKGRNYWFTIYEDEEGLNTEAKSFFCYSGTIDIVAEDANPISADKSYPFSWYFDRIFNDTGIRIGINEISHLSRKLEFTSENATNVEMLQYVLNGFDNAEAELTVTFEGSAPNELLLNVYKRIGEEEPQALLSDEDDTLTDLTKRGSISQLATCINPKGAEENDQVVTLTNKYYEERGANGVLLYVSPIGSPRIFSLQARKDYYVKLPGKADDEYSGYINRRYSSQAKTQDALWIESLAQLKKIDHAIIEYEANGRINCNRGDNVQIVSHTMNPPLFLSARVTEYQFNDDDSSRNKYKFSNFEELESNLDELSKLIEGLKPYLKPGDTYYPWIRYADDDKGSGLSATPLNKKYMAITYGLNQPSPSDDPKDYVGLWVKIVGEKGDQGIEGPPGIDGLPRYMWVMYADDFSGTGISERADGKKYIGIAYNKTNETPSKIPSDYSWSAMYDEDALEEIQKKVDSIVYSVTSISEPKNPVIGQAWWQQDSNDIDKIIGYFVWDGKSWQPQTVQQSILNIIELNAVKIYGAEITGTTINGSKFTNTFSYELSSGAKVTGVFDIENGAISFEAVDTLGYKYTYQMDTRRGVISKTEDINGNYQSGNLGNGVLALFKKQGSEIVGGSLTADALAPKEWININYEAGFTTAEYNPCQYRIITLVDGTKELQLRGQVKPTSGNFPTNGSPGIAILPIEARPSRNELLMVADSTKKGARVGVLASGVIQVAAVNGSSYVALGGIRVTL